MPFTIAPAYSAVVKGRIFVAVGLCYSRVLSGIWILPAAMPALFTALQQ